MQFDIVTIFPQFFDSFLAHSLVKRAIANERINIRVHNLRDYSKDKHQKVDDTPFGGGPGMVLTPQPLFDAVRAILESSPYDRKRIRVVMLTPQGSTFTQTRARDMSTSYDQVLFLCGRYEGFDERVREFLIDEQLSIGDFVIQGGEVPAMLIIEAVSRLLPGVLGDDTSSHDESFSHAPDQLEYPQYTKPADFEGMKVPEILQNGHHKQIEEWRRTHMRKKP